MKNGKIVKSIKLLIKAFTKEFKTFLSKYYESVFDFWFVFCVFVLCINDSTANRFICILFIYMLRIIFVKSIRMLKKETSQIPRIKKRLTYKTEDGEVMVSRNDWNEAILYLYMVENYMEKQ